MIQEIRSRGITPYLTVIPRLAGINWPDQGFQDDGIAVTKTGTIYAGILYLLDRNGHLLAHHAR